LTKKKYFAEVIHQRFFADLKKSKTTNEKEGAPDLAKLYPGAKEVGRSLKINWAGLSKWGPVKIGIPLRTGGGKDKRKRDHSDSVLSFKFRLRRRDIT